MLFEQGHVSPAQDIKTIDACKGKAHQLNRLLINKARGSNDVAYLASPVTGGGYPVSRFQQLFLLAQSQGQKTPDAWANFVWQILASQGQQLIKAGATLTTPEENMKELTEQATTFHEKLMPIIKALQII